MSLPCQASVMPAREGQPRPAVMQTRSRSTTAVSVGLARGPLTCLANRHGPPRYSNLWVLMITLRITQGYRAACQPGGNSAPNDSVLGFSRRDCKAELIQNNCSVRPSGLLHDRHHLGVRRWLALSPAACPLRIAACFVLSEQRWRAWLGVPVYRADAGSASSVPMVWARARIWPYIRRWSSLSRSSSCGCCVSPACSR